MSTKLLRETIRLIVRADDHEFMAKIYRQLDKIDEAVKKEEAFYKSPQGRAILEERARRIEEEAKTYKRGEAIVRECRQPKRRNKVWGMGN